MNAQAPRSELGSKYVVPSDHSVAEKGQLLAHGHSLCVLVPAKNEEGTLGHVIDDVRYHVPGAAIVVLDDDSQDGTYAVAVERSCSVLRFGKETSGLGRIMSEGLRFAWSAGFDLVASIDGDGQYNAEDLKRVLEAKATTEHAIVVGNRLWTRPRHMRRVRYLQNVMMSRAVSMMCRQHIPDSQSGLRVLDRRTAYLPLECRFTYVQEQLLAAAREGLGVEIIPIQFSKRRHGSSRLVSGALDYLEHVTPVFLTHIRVSLSSEYNLLSTLVSLLGIGGSRRP